MHKNYAVLFWQQQSCLSSVLRCILESQLLCHIYVMWLKYGS